MNLNKSLMKELLRNNTINGYWIFNMFSKIKQAHCSETAKGIFHSLATQMLEYVNIFLFFF